MTEQAGSSKSVALMTQALEWAYEQAAANAENLAETQLKSCRGDRELAIDKLITWYITYAGAVGFTSNVGGLLTMPVAVPTNIAGVLYLQLRLIAAIAYLRGYPVNDQKVRALALVCLTGNSALSVLQEAGIGISTKIAAKIIAQIPVATLKKINAAVGFRLITKAGSTGVVNLTKFVPIAGGLVGGAFDATVTWGIGAASKKLFTAIDFDASDLVEASAGLSDDRMLEPSHPK